MLKNGPGNDTIRKRSNVAERGKPGKGSIIPKCQCRKSKYLGLDTTLLHALGPSLLGALKRVYFL